MSLSQRLYQSTTSKMIIRTLKTLENDLFHIGHSPYFYIFSSLFILLPVALITGPFLPDLFLTLIALYFLVTSIQKRLFTYFQNKFVYIFAIFCLYIIINGFFSNDPIASLIKSNGPIFYFRYLFFILGCWYLLDRNPKLIHYFCGSLLLVIIFVIFDGLVQWQTGTNLLGFRPTGNRIPGIFKDEEILGHFLSHVVPLAFALMLFLFKFQKKQIVLMMIFLILSEVFIFITNDRSAFLKIFQFTVLLIFLSNRFKLFRILSFIISMIIISIILFNSPFSKGRYSQTLDSVQSTKIPYMPWTPAHEQHFALAFDFFLENPVFGKGPQYFKYTCINQPDLMGCTSHPHNYYFQTLAELGLVGVGFLFFSLLYLSIILIRQFFNVWVWKKNTYFIPDHLVSLYSLIFLFVWPLIPNASFYNNWINVMVFLPIPFILYFRSVLKK